jgi:hypothetical protein
MAKEKVLFEELLGAYRSIMCSETDSRSNTSKQLFVKTIIHSNKTITKFEVYQDSKLVANETELCPALARYNEI